MLKVKGYKGITLIALVISIIVLLILAGVTINAISGSDSAPAKANEAGQKNDIGAAKDDISLTATNAKLQGMETAYVSNGVSSTDASTTVGQAVINAVLDKNGTSIGKASIEVEQATTDGNLGDATITISTTDFEVIGKITLQDGILIWGEIESTSPNIKLSSTTLSIEPAKNDTLSVEFKKMPNTTPVIWTSSDENNKISVNNGTVSVDSSVVVGTKATITAKVTYNETDFIKTCIINVVPGKVAQINSKIGNLVNYVSPEASGYNGTWQIFYANNSEVFIIPTTVVELNVPIGGTNTTSNQYVNGSDDIAVNSYGRIYNEKWFSSAGMPSTYNNAKTVAYLCDTTKWRKYIESTQNINGFETTIKGKFGSEENQVDIPNNSYAVGGPTIELLEKSVSIKYPDIVMEYLTTNNKGYNIKSMEYGAFNDTLFLVTDTSYWLASPYNNDNRYVSVVYKQGRVSSREYTDYQDSSYYGNPGIRPLISIPLDSFDITWIVE